MLLVTQYLALIFFFFCKSNCYFFLKIIFTVQTSPKRTQPISTSFLKNITVLVGAK